MEVPGGKVQGSNAYEVICRFDGSNAQTQTIQANGNTLQQPPGKLRGYTKDSIDGLPRTPEIFDELETKILKETENVNETLSLYATISEKNRVIQALKQRLMNQQLQLAYYLHKNLFNENVLEFSARCTPKISDQNIELSLAMCNFMKDSNGTKKLCKLHEKLNEYDQKVTEILSKQEELVKSAVEDEFHDLNSQNSSTHSEIYKKIMTTTAEVKKELAELRTCSEQINCLESEKNALYDFIFNLPEQKREALLSIQDMEQFRKKCKEIDQPINQPVNQNTLKPKEIHLVKKISNTHLKVLPEKPRSAKEICQERELQALRKENEKLNSILETITEASNPFRVLELEAKCGKIERDLEDVRRGLELEVEAKEEDIQRLSEELKLACDQSSYFEEQLLDLRTSVNLVVEENELLQNALEKFTESKEAEALDQLKEIIRNQKEQIRKLVLLICNLKEDDSILDGDFKLSISSRNGEEVDDSGLFSAKTEFPLEEEPKISKAEINIGNEYIESIPSKTSFHSKQYSSSNYITSSKEMKDCSQMADLREKLTTTSLEVESFDQNGKKESLRATLESTTNLGGVLEMENSSNLRLRLHCFSGTKTNNFSREKIPKQSQSLFSIPPPENLQESRNLPEKSPVVSRETQYSQKITRGKEAIVNNIKRIYSHILGQK